MGVSKGGGEIYSIQERILVERGVSSRDKQGMAAWAQVLIVREVIVS